MLTLHKSHSLLGKYMGKLIGGYCTVKHIRNHTGKYFEKKQFATSSRVKVLTKKHPFVVKLDDTIFESLANPSEPSVPELIPSSFTGKWKDIEKILSKDLLVEFCKKYKLSSTGTKKALASRLRGLF